MKKSTLVKVVVCALALAVVVALAFVVKAPETTYCIECDGAGADCEVCAGTGIVETVSVSDSPYYSTFMALVPPVIAIALALMTKEVYSSLFVGIAAGGILYAVNSPLKTPS